ncbi:hypothetical protein HPG69_000965 [Diceros bicornis minor]|uniref:GH18 domain-containing protein n=1 Tax=Diceros bicornis minor TaxID=77932 RepID=A0A7J7E5C0_DICBM|nr:hypothetical protein HPG69_000965 [Diceros bicornis minor]
MFLIPYCHYASQNEEKEVKVQCPCFSGSSCCLPIPALGWKRADSCSILWLPLSFPSRAVAVNAQENKEEMISRTNHARSLNQIPSGTLAAGLERLAVLLQVQLGAAYKLLGYFTNWDQHREEPAKFLPKDVDPCLCTHLIYAFTTINDKKIAPCEWNDIDVFNGDLVNLLAIGGWNFGTQKCTTMVSMAANCKIFTCPLTDFLHQHGFDGIDLDIEYPGPQGILPDDKQRFTILIKETLEAFEKEAKETGYPRLLITAAVSASKGTTDSGYEIAEIGKLPDFINVMTYDFHGGWDTCTGHNSPLHLRPKDQGDMHYFNCEYATKYWRDHGVPAEKLVMGFPSCGRTFWLSTSDTLVCAPVSGAGSSGPYTREAGFCAYYKPQVLGLKTKMSPMLVKTMTELAMTTLRAVDVELINQMVQTLVNFLKENNFGRAMVWVIDLDDFSGSFCNEGKYPLTSKLKSLLGLSSGASLLSLPRCSKEDTGQAAKNGKRREARVHGGSHRTSRHSHLTKRTELQKAPF